ncbi:hypothetical protein C8R44DRAFT_757223 [Mycena epipterygia]|nr:hypothetical protein C8R44DRAFT_757223 [Mycena epipterygia]
MRRLNSHRPIEANSFRSLSHLQIAALAGTVGGVVGALLVVLAACLLVRRLRRRQRHSAVSTVPSFFPRRRSTFTTYASSGSTRRPPHTAEPEDLEAGMQEEDPEEVFDALDLVGPLQMHAVPDVLPRPFLQLGGAALEVTVVGAPEGLTESCAASIEGAPSESSARTIETRDPEKSPAFQDIEGEGPGLLWRESAALERPDSIHIAPPDYASSCVS